MTKKISGAEYPLSKIFSSDFDYSIPSYQRPYAWTDVQAGELFADLYDFFTKEKEDTYFLGSIVLIKDEGKPRAEVIDGQQRLTTLTILLAVITSRFEGDLRADFETYIREPGRASQGLEAKPRLSLRERDRAFFAQYVQSLSVAALVDKDPTQLSNESQRNVRRNAELFLTRIGSHFGDDTKRLCEFGAFLVQRAFLVVVSTPSQQSAFRVFSVLNSRGLDLLPTDIIKSDVIGSIPVNQQDEFTETWEGLEVDTGREGFAEVFAHIRMIRSKDKARRALIEEFRDKVINGQSGADVVSKCIEPFVKAYLIAKNGHYLATSNADEVNALIGWLNRIENSDWLPPAMLFLSEKESDSAYVLWFFRKLERLAASMVVCGLDVNARIERYASVLAGLEGTHSLQKPVSQVELTLEEKAAMLRVLDGPIYDMSARRRNYLILRLDSFLSDRAAVYDLSRLTVEHVLPQTIDPASKWAEWWPSPDVATHWVHRMANLVPLNQRRNSAARNFDFDRKKSAYFGGKEGVSSYASTTQVLNEKEWTPSVVQKRQSDLLSLLRDRWDLA